LLCIFVVLARFLPSSIETLLAKQQEFVSDAGHELKTPLAIINTNIDVLQNEVGKNQWFENIKLQTQRMNRLVNDLLTLLKTADGQANVIKKRFNLSSTVLNLVLEIESRAFEKGKQYSFDIEENIFYVGNERLIKRFLGVLIDNAIGYSDKNGEIKTTLTKKGKRVYISVYNTGMGVKTKDINRIFERFYRVDESRSRETGGTGLGLPIAKAIADTHKGKITVTGVPSKWVKFELMLRTRRV
jgi:signal transduction histidine kinase